MKKTKNTFIAVILCFLFLLSGCSGAEDTIMASMVQWDLDSIYLNKHDETYLTMCDITEEEAVAYYEDGILYDADYFSYYWGITDDSTVYFTDLDEELQTSIFNLCDTISKKAKYTVGDAAKLGEDSYVVEVVVEPIDIMEQADSQFDSYEPLNAFFAKTENIDFETISDEDYMALFNEYGNIIVGMFEELLPNLGYLEATSMTITVETVDDYWVTDENDLATFNELYISYPYFE